MNTEGRILYFTRHGESEWNTLHKICGATDSPLTERGQEQARELGRRIAKEGIHIDEILYSPLSRAADTARRISEITGIPVREEPRLVEQNFGKYEGTPRGNEEFAAAKQNFFYHYEGGESMAELCHRVYSLLDDLRDDPSGKVYLLAAHTGILRAVESYFREMTNEEFAHFGMENCGLREYRFV